MNLESSAERLTSDALLCGTLALQSVFCVIALSCSSNARAGVERMCVRTFHSGKAPAMSPIHLGQPCLGQQGHRREAWTAMPV